MRQTQYDPDHLLSPGNAINISSSFKDTPGFSLDKLFDKMGIKWYHIRLLLTVGSVAVSEGAQIVIITLSVTLAQKSWNFSDATRSLLATLSFFGVVLGSAIAGFFGDRFGRKKPMLGSVISMTVLNLISGFSVNVAMFAVLRTLVGIALGFFAPLGYTYVVENVPKKHRGKIVMLSAACMFVGQLIACGMAFLTVDNLVEGNWKNLILVSTALFLISLILCILYLDESLRYLMVMGRFDEGFELIQKILRVNKNSQFTALTEEQKEDLQSWEHTLEGEVSNSDIASIKALFKGKFRRLTMIIWYGWFVNFFVYYGLLLLLPWTLAKLAYEGDQMTDTGNGDLTRLTVSVLIESLSVVVATLTITFTSISQRKSLIIFFLLTGISTVIILIPMATNVFVLLATLTKLLINVCTFYYYLFTLETYPTKYRATGLGVGIAVGKVATVLVPFTCYGIAEAYLFAPFGLFAALCFVASWAVFKLPQDIEEQDLK